MAVINIKSMSWPSAGGTVQGARYHLSESPHLLGHATVQNPQAQSHGETGVKSTHKCPSFRHTKGPQDKSIINTQVLYLHIFPVLVIS